MPDSPKLFKDDVPQNSASSNSGRPTPGRFLRHSMDRIRRSFRDSFRRRASKERGGLTAGQNGSSSTPSSSNGDNTRPQNWLQDEASVRTGTCNYNVKYLGCVEVFESRGMKVCEEALKVLRTQRRRPVRGVLYVSGDGLRVVDADNKGLIVDQTIEKVSFCAPDRSHEKGFAYICRDGTTRRWMCHGFHANKETGERLSHAVGCAFAVCMEKKQKRDRLTCSGNFGTSGSLSEQNTPAHKDKEGSQVNTNNAFQQQPSFRQASLSERLLDPQNVIGAPGPPPASSVCRQVIDTANVIKRPQPNPQLFERQGSLRMPQGDDRFKRQQSLRVQDLPSTINRQSQMGVARSKVNAIPEVTEEQQAEMENRFNQVSLNSNPGLQHIQNTSQRPRGEMVHANTIAGPPSAHWQDLDYGHNSHNIQSTSTSTSPPQLPVPNSMETSSPAGLGRSVRTMSGRGQQWLESTHQLLISAQQVAQSRPSKSMELATSTLSPVAENGFEHDDNNGFDPHSCPPPPLPSISSLPSSPIPPPLPPRIIRNDDPFETKWKSFEDTVDI